MTIQLTVNGEARTVEAPPRAHLAEILRDHLDLTATHLGCEQGVCGACTVLVDGRPVRSCLTYADACEGAQVETIEGYAGDRTMAMLRDAFSRHHALQCGFCTPGMLATARDIVERLGVADEERIRYELSGNLCRCTGYVGIVRAISEVIEAKGAGAATAAPPEARPRGFQPFEARTPEAEAPASPAYAGSIANEDGFTIVKRTIELNHPLPAAWAHFSDLNRLASCMPGAALTHVDATTFAGQIEVRFGLISARFAGEGTYALDDARRSGSIAGRGKANGGQSNVSGEMAYALMEGTAPSATRVDLTFRFQIQGALAQFNRPELVNGFVDYLLGEFVANCDRVLSGGEARKARGVSVFALARSLVSGWAKTALSRRKG